MLQCIARDRPYFFEETSMPMARLVSALDARDSFSLPSITPGLVPAVTLPALFF